MSAVNTTHSPKKWLQDKRSIDISNRKGSEGLHGSISFIVDPQLFAMDYVSFAKAMGPTHRELSNLERRVRTFIRIINNFDPKR